MDTTLYGLLMRKIKSASQDFRDLMKRQNEQDERITLLENSGTGSDNGSGEILFFEVTLTGSQEKDLSVRNIPESLLQILSSEYCLISTHEDVSIERYIDDTDGDTPHIYLINSSDTMIKATMIATNKQHSYDTLYNSLEDK